MKCCATVATKPASPEVLTRASLPAVFVDHVFEPRLRVASARYASPLDQRTVLLDIDADEETMHALLHRWQHAHIVAAWPSRLIDDTTRWQVLSQGRLGSRHRKTNTSRNWQVELIDHWAESLNSPMKQVWWQDANGKLIPETAGKLITGSLGNRSSQRVQIHGTQVYTLQATGQPWRVGDALESIFAMAGLNVSLALLPQDMAMLPITQTIDLTKPTGRVLTQLLEPIGLVIDRQMTLAAEKVTQRIAVRDPAHSRKIHLRWANMTQPASDVLSIWAEADAPASQQWIAHGSSWQIESTFDLVAGWDPALQSQPEAEYARSSSSNFSTFANVFRSWVLNEDGWYTSAPYNQTQAFDLANFFNQPHLRPQPLRLRDCLTLDDAGKSLPPIVEISIDAGVTWSQHPGKADVLADRVGVYFADDQLPAGFIAAAQAGDARVRITGTLTSPESTQIARWQGNAFAGTLLPRQLDVADSFIFRKVSSTSIHAADVATGARQAMEHDDTLAMERWLIQQMQRSNTHTLGAGRGRLELAGCWPQLRIGDQLFDAGGQAKDITNHATAVLQQGVTVTAISHELDSARSTANPRTRVDVRF